VSNPILGGLPRDKWAAMIQSTGHSGLSGLLGVEITELRDGYLRATLNLRGELMLFGGGYIHAGTVVAFADTCAGWGCLASLPDHARGFTTIELKTNLLATAKESDALNCEASMVHAGRTTQVWDARVARASDDRQIAVYRCTQALLDEDRNEAARKQETKQALHFTT
jgi:1,4-dihydroxy-2-naphthoyl-CoA hydrolase